MWVFFKNYNFFLKTKRSFLKTIGKQNKKLLFSKTINNPKADYEELTTVENATF